MELLIGCGTQRSKKLYREGKKLFDNLVTLDVNEERNPDVVWDLRKHPLPFEDNTFDEIHAYEVLEHLAHQGDFKFFFNEFSEYHRILKPGGLFMATVPHKDSIWALGDPSHKRIIVKENLMFLRQKTYEEANNTTISDFRNIYKADFNLIWLKENEEQLKFILEAKK